MSVAALVLTRNRKELLLECLAGLDGQTVKPDRVVIVDNASDDGTPELLRERGVVRRRGHIKVLARGDISKKLTVRAHKFSGKAAEKIAAAGGAAEVLGAQ